MWCSIYIVYPLVLSRSNLKLHQTLEVKNFLNKENRMLQLTFNPGLTLTSFRTTRPSIVIGHFRLLFCLFWCETICMETCLVYRFIFTQIDSFHIKVCTKIRFETEAQRNLGMAYFLQWNCIKRTPSIKWTQSRNLLPTITVK